MMTVVALPAIVSEKSEFYCSMNPPCRSVKNFGTHPAKGGRVLSVVFCFLGNKKASGHCWPEAFQ